MLNKDTRNVLVRFEVADDMTDDHLHEGLCKVIHEGEASEDHLMGMTLDIEVLEISQQELFDLGAAYISFQKGDIDQGVDLVLYCTDSDDGSKTNEVFKALNDNFLLIHDETEHPLGRGINYMDAIVAWAFRNDVEIGR